MICAYLLYNYNFSVTSEALAYYGEARTKNNKVRMPAVDCTLVHNVYIKTYIYDFDNSFQFQGNLCILQLT